LLTPHWGKELSWAAAPAMRAATARVNFILMRSGWFGTKVLRMYRVS